MTERRVQQKKNRQDRIHRKHTTDRKNVESMGWGDIKRRTVRRSRAEGIEKTKRTERRKKTIIEGQEGQKKQKRTEGTERTKGKQEAQKE